MPVSTSKSDWAGLAPAVFLNRAGGSDRQGLGSDHRNGGAGVRLPA
jgi:hypothetical protein